MKNNQISNLNLNCDNGIVDLSLQQQQQISGGAGINYDLLDFLEQNKNNSVVAYGKSEDKANTFFVNVLADLGTNNVVTQT